MVSPASAWPSTSSGVSSGTEEVRRGRSGAAAGPARARRRPSPAARRGRRRARCRPALQERRREEAPAAVGPERRGGGHDVADRGAIAGPPETACYTREDSCRRPFYCRRRSRRNACDQLDPRAPEPWPVRADHAHELLLLRLAQRLRAAAALHPAARRRRGRDRARAGRCTARPASSASRWSAPSIDDVGRRLLHAARRAPARRRPARSSWCRARCPCSASCASCRAWLLGLLRGQLSPRGGYRAR